MTSQITKRLFIIAALAVTPLFATPTLPAATCESLSALKLSGVTINAAQTVPAGAFTPPGDAPNGPALAAFKTLPAFCRVTATLHPQAIPTSKSKSGCRSRAGTRKFQAVGNGGFAGVISYPALAAAVTAGYASASTDTGHQGNTAAFALGHPEKVIDFADRAVHEMTVKAKAIVSAYYGARTGALVLEWLLHGRAARNHGGCEIPGGLRRRSWPVHPRSTGCVSSSPEWPSTCSLTGAKTVTSRP